MRGAQRTERRARIDGVLLLDKPLGLSSNAALMQARRLFGAAKAGHGGTLDPLATGLLPIAFGEATKFLHDVLDSDKTYEATLALGMTTTTGDAEGEPVRTEAVTATDAEIRCACAAFVGDIEQVPPMHSALKREGKPLYAYARAGQVLEREPRRVRICALDVLAIERLPAVRVRLRVHCSKGTYVRVLAEDIGARLGCGAHLAALRRVAVGTLSVAHAVTLESLAEREPEARLALLAPVDALVSTLARIDLPEAVARRFIQGQRIVVDDAGMLAEARAAARRASADASAAQRASLQVRVYGDERLLGVALFTPPGLIAPARLVQRASTAAH